MAKCLYECTPVHSTAVGRGAHSTSEFKGGERRTRLNKNRRAVRQRCIARRLEDIIREERRRTRRWVGRSRVASNCASHVLACGYCLQQGLCVSVPPAHGGVQLAGVKGAAPCARHIHTNWVRHLSLVFPVAAASGSASRFLPPAVGRVPPASFACVWWRAST